MKVFLAGLLTLISFSSFSQSDKTITVTVDVGGCINSGHVSRMAVDEEEWELRIIPLNHLDREIEDRIQNDRFDDDIRSIGRNANRAVFKGPMLETTINLKSNEKLKVELWEKDWGLAYILGGNGYILSTIDSELITKNAPFVIGKANKKFPTARDCLSIQEN